MKISLWVPSAESMARWACVESWWNLETPDNIKLRLLRGRPNNLKYEWNRVIKEFLETGDDWLLSWHSDVVGVPQTLMRLLSWNKPIVSALIFMRQSPVTPHAWQRREDSETRYTQCLSDIREWFNAHPEYIKFEPFVMEPRPDDALKTYSFTSTSCMLIHRDVFEATRPLVGDKWFVMDDDLRGGGEDRRFCEYARQAGFETYIDRSCVVGHLPGDIPNSSIHFMTWDTVSTFDDNGQVDINIYSKE